jgi:hypothetical protein
MSFVYIVRVDLSLLLFLSTLITHLIQNKIYNYCLLRPGMLSCCVSYGSYCCLCTYPFPVKKVLIYVLPNSPAWVLDGKKN